MALMAWQSGAQMEQRRKSRAAGGVRWENSASAGTTSMQATSTHERIFIATIETSAGRGGAVGKIDCGE